MTLSLIFIMAVLAGAEVMCFGGFGTVMNESDTCADNRYKASVLHLVHKYCNKLWKSNTYFTNYKLYVLLQIYYRDVSQELQHRHELVQPRELKKNRHIPTCFYKPHKFSQHRGFQTVWCQIWWTFVRGPSFLKYILLSYIFSWSIIKH